MDLGRKTSKEPVLDIWCNLEHEQQIYIFGKLLLITHYVGTWNNNIAGGDEGAANRDIKDIMVFDADNGAWNKIGEMNQGRYRHATSIIEADPEALCGTTWFQ